MRTVLFDDQELDPVRRVLAKISDTGGREPDEREREAKAALRILWAASRRSRHERFDASHRKDRQVLAFWKLSGVAAGIVFLSLLVSLLGYLWERFPLD